MKIEKINDNQIRCTLTREDLASRKMKLSELAYGTDKAKALFQDMMYQAQCEVGFEADNTPIMIEAIPLSGDAIVLIITKVEDPEELDTRFSRFSPDGTAAAPTEKKPQYTGADDILDLFQKIHEARTRIQEEQAAKKQQNEPSRPSQPAPAPTAASEPAEPVNLIQAFSFHTLDEVITAAKSLGGCYAGRNTLYKEHMESDDYYRLILQQSETSPETFNKICNILSEYGYNTNITPSGEAYLKEHGSVLIADEAVQQLSAL